LKKTVDAELVPGPLHEISEFRTINYDGVMDTSYTLKHRSAVILDMLIN